jgi:hypothetical protein
MCGEEMQKLTLKHIGAVSLGRLLAIWSFVLGVIMLLMYTVFLLLMGLLGLAAKADIVQMLVGIVIMFLMGVIGLVVGAILMFILGFLAAVIYNIILGVGGGIDFDVNERK